MADIRLILWRLRPNSSYLWGGGSFDDYSQILEWRDPNTTQPTEQEINDEWNVYLSEQAALEAEQQTKDAAQNDVNIRFLASQLAGKTPQEIYTLMQNRMDSWTSLADARSDLREWLPLMAAIIAWKVQ